MIVLKNQKKIKTYFHNAIAKYGIDNFSFDIIETVYNTDKNELMKCLNDLEQKYIKHYNTFNKKYGYNLTSGGGGICGFHLSEDHKKLISERNKGRKLSEEHKQRIGDFMRSDKNPNRGKHLSEETKDKIRQSHIGMLSGNKNPMYGKKRPDVIERNLNSGFKIVQKNIETNEIIKIWNSLREISRETGWNRSCISDCCNKKTRQSHGYYWEYLNEINI